MSATSSNGSMGKRIVIIGGGFAGTATALNLEKIYRRDPSVEITLIDSENFFTFTPLLAEVPSGSIQPSHVVVPLRALLKRTRVKQAEVKSVDLESRTVIARIAKSAGTNRFRSISWSWPRDRCPTSSDCPAWPNMP